MKMAFLVVGLAAVLGCGSASSGPAPVLSNLSIKSPVKVGSTVSGQVEVSDSAGLGSLTLEVTITAPNGAVTMSTAPIQGGSSTLTEAALPFEFLLSASTAAGTYSVSIAVTENGQTSNTIKTSVVVQ